MYHYRECGLPNQYLVNGYREVQTPYGLGIAIEEVEALHTVIASTLVEEKPYLTGPEVRFIRKHLDLTQEELGRLLGVEGQSVRRWERLGRVPKQADHGIRLVFRDMTGRLSRPLTDLLRQLEAAASVAAVHYSYRPRAKEHWRPQVEAA